MKAAHTFIKAEMKFVYNFQNVILERGAILERLHLNISLSNREQAGYPVVVCFIYRLHPARLVLLGHVVFQPYILGWQGQVHNPSYLYLFQNIWNSTKRHVTALYCLENRAQNARRDSTLTPQLRANSTASGVAWVPLEVTPFLWPRFGASYEVLPVSKVTRPLPV